MTGIKRIKSAQYFGKEAALVASFVVYVSSVRERGSPGGLFCGIRILSSGKRLSWWPLLWYTYPRCGKEALLVASFVVYVSSVRERGGPGGLFCGIRILSSGKRLSWWPLLWYRLLSSGKRLPLWPLLWYTRRHASVAPSLLRKRGLSLPSFVVYCSSVRERGSPGGLFCGIRILSSGKRRPWWPLLWYTYPQFGKEAALVASFVVYSSSRLRKRGSPGGLFCGIVSSVRERGYPGGLFCGILLLSSGKRLSWWPLLWYTYPQFGKEAALVASFVVYVSSRLRKRGLSLPSFVVYVSSVRERGAPGGLFCGILVLTTSGKRLKPALFCGIRLLSSGKRLSWWPLLWYTSPQFGKEAALVASFVVYVSSVRERGSPGGLFWLFSNLRGT